MFMDNTVEFEGSPQETALQRLWARRLTLTGCLVEEPESSVLDDIFPAAVQSEDGDKNCSAAFEAANDVFDSPEQDWTKATSESRPRLLRLDGAQLGDFPARYVVPAVDAHEFPVVGVWVDPAVVPGFRYRVRPIETQAGRAQRSGAHLFGGRALVLQSVGRGYSRRITFLGDKLNHNDNYFWSDSRPNGYAFEIEAVAAGDKFTLHDANKMAAGTLEVVRLEGPQAEAARSVTIDGSVEKRVRFRAIAKIEWFESQRAVVLPVSGVAVCRRARGQPTAAVAAVVDVAVGSQRRRGFSLSPGGSDRWRRTLVHGRSIGDVPTSYVVVGLEPHEMPVIGTYVDARIVPGFAYKVRPAGWRRPLFGGRALRLTGVGPGYGKRLTFAAAGRSNAGAEHLWSDTFAEGVGMELRAVEAGRRFHVTAAGVTLGEAVVFRADAPQTEVDEQRVTVAGEVTIIKHVQVDVTCHVRLAGGADSVLTRVSGLAVLDRRANEAEAALRRVQDIGLASQLNLLFARQHADLVFYPV